MALPVLEKEKILNSNQFKYLSGIQHVDIQLEEIGEPADLDFLKRIFDVVFSFCALTFLFPIFFFIGALIKLKDPKGPMFFAHKRLGQNGKEFKCYKFRTMVTNADVILKKMLENPEIRAEYEKDFKLKDDPRIIPIVGNFLRKTSLDELPQFLNVLLGDMSVVGPRPIIKNEMIKYGTNINTFLSAKPGVTGLWQVSGRNDVSYDERVALDMHYINNGSFLLDISIIFKTVKIILSKNGAY